MVHFGVLHHMKHSLQITLTKEGTYLLTSAGGRFGLWKMAEKIRTCSKRRINGGHNVVYDVSPNVADLNVGLRSDYVASSYNGDVDSSSSNVFTNNIGIFGQKWFNEEEKEEEGREENMDDFVHKSTRFLPMNLPNPK